MARSSSLAADSSVKSRRNCGPGVWERPVNPSWKAASTWLRAGYVAFRSHEAYRYTMASASAPITAARSLRRSSGSSAVGKPSVPWNA